jgi:hypothetical protein
MERPKDLTERVERALHPLKPDYVAWWTHEESNGGTAYIPFAAPTTLRAEHVCRLRGTFWGCEIEIDFSPGSHHDDNPELAIYIKVRG